MRYRVLPITFAFGPVMHMCALPGVTGALPVDDRRVRIPWTLPGITDAIPVMGLKALPGITGRNRNELHHDALPAVTGCHWVWPVMTVGALPSVTRALPVGDRRVHMPQSLPGITDGNW